MFYSDLPIDKSSDDLLNRASFAKSLAKAMVKHSSSEAFTIGLYGSWGSGKTSVINMVLEELYSLQDESVVILKFNPWMCSDEKQLVSQFFKQLSSTLKMKNKRFWKIATSILDYLDLLEQIEGIGKGWQVASSIAKVLRSHIKSGLGERDNNLQKKKDEIISYLSKTSIRIVITIDDMDRLSEREIVAVFQLVKALADFPNTIYLLAFDYDIVVNALTSVQSGNGEEYLKKIVQMPFALPTADINDIENILMNRLECLVANVPAEEWDNGRWNKLYTSGIKHYITSIRDINRFINTISLKFEMLKDETNIIDLIGITCLQVFEPALYDKIPLYEKVLCGICRSSAYTRENNQRNAYEMLIDGIDDKNKPYARGIIETLFPYASLTTSDSIYSERAQFLIKKNIASPDVFLRYFALTLSPNDIPSSIVKQIIFSADESNFSYYVREIAKYGKSEALIKTLESYCSQTDNMQIAPARAADLVFYLSANWEEFKFAERKSLLAVEPEWRFESCVNVLLQYIDKTERFTLLKRIFESEKVSVAVLSMILLLLEKQHNRFSNETREYSISPLVPELELHQLESSFAARVLEEINTDKLLNCKKARLVLFLYSKIDSDSFESLKESFIKTDTQLALLIHHYIGHGRYASTTEAGKTWTVDNNGISNYIDISMARKRISAFLKSEDFRELGHDIQLDIIAFIVNSEKNAPNNGSEKENIMSFRESVLEERLQEELIGTNYAP